MPSLSPIEAAVLLALGGSLLAVGVPEFARGLHASRLAEPIDGLKRMASGAVAYASANRPEGPFPASAPLTPAEVPRGVRADDPAGAWEHPSWRALGFAFDYAHAFSFEFVSDAPGGQPHFRAIAHGDLDGDGVVSTFELEGKADPAGASLVPGMYVDREVE